ncbi:hypothetical protein L3Q82_018398, partial [Scortum barcoo]
QVKRQLERLHQRKVAGPDGITPRILKTCASQLSPVLGHLYNLSLSQEKVPMLWKTSCLVPVPKKSRPSDPADYRPVALTSHVMKVLERLVLAQLRPQPLLLGEKLRVMGVDDSMISWITDYLTGRPQFVRLGSVLSDVVEEEDGLHSHYGSGGEVVEEVEDYKYLGVVIDNRLDWKSNTGGCVQEGDEQTLFPEEAEILQRGQQDVGDFLPVCCCQCHFLCCRVLGQQHQSQRH